MTEYMTPEQVCELVPGISEGQLAMMRYRGKGPKYYKPTARKIIYKRSEIIEWVENSQKTKSSKKED